MKKLNILLAAIFIFTGGLFSQTNVSTINQTVNGHDANVSQNGIKNESHITQAASTNKAEIIQKNNSTALKTLSNVLQTGSNNLVEVNQNSEVPDINNEGTLDALVEQSGNKNQAYQQQGPADRWKKVGASVEKIYQAGDNNYASQIQIKHANEAIINQVGSNNKAEQGQDIEILPDQEGSHNMATILQSGHWNQAAQSQNGLSNTAFIEQTGNKNKATQTQIGMFNSAKSVQGGLNNTSIQEQKSLASFNSADVTQMGSNSFATQIQNGFFTVANNAVIFQEMGSDNNTSTQEQLGYKNSAFAYQSGAGNTAMQKQEGKYNEESIVQTGNGNNATQEQLGYLNVAKANQAGANNKAVQTQGLDWNKGIIMQNASNGTAIQLQKSGLGGTKVLNDAEIIQLGGTSNEAYQTQTSPGGGAEVNYAKALQDGSLNSVNQTQFGGNNSSIVSQSGTGSVAVVNQTMP